MWRAARKPVSPSEEAVVASFNPPKMATFNMPLVVLHWDEKHAAGDDEALRQRQHSRLLKMAILGGLQLATTAFSEGDTGLRAALHTPEDLLSHLACFQRL